LGHCSAQLIIIHRAGKYLTIIMLIIIIIIIIVIIK